MEALLRDLSREKHVLIAGPTASGKSGLALEIAARHGGVIVNADALQVYGCWRVLSARPSAGEEAQAEHRLYGHVSHDTPYSVGHWLREVAELLATGRRLIVVGGTGLYFTALTEGLAEIPAVPPEVRAEADALRLGGAVARMIEDLDPATRARVDLRNPARVQRAWEVWRTTGRGLAAWQDETPRPLLPLARAEPLVLRPDRDWLAARIDSRFDTMLQAGALDEASAALDWWRPDLPAARAIGAAELVAHVQGVLSLDEAVTRAKVASRQYAKRQRTWFRARMGAWRSVPLP